MPIIHIRALTDPALLPFSSLTRRAGQAGLKDCFIAETRTVILNAAANGCEPVSFLISEKCLAGRDRDLPERFENAVFYTAEDSVLEELTGYALTRGILALMKNPPARSLESIVRNARRLAVLEGVQDASNIGAVLRSAAALGMDGVLLDSACCDPLHRKAVRTSMGGVFAVPWAKLSCSGTETVRQLNALGFTTAAFALSDAAVPLQAAPFYENTPVALVFGAEGPGLHDETVKACKAVIRIPMRHGMDSLNIATAAAIAFWELTRSMLTAERE